METIAVTPGLLSKVTEGLAAREIYLPPETVEYITRLESGEEIGISCWRSDLTLRKKGSKIEGRGLFAKKRLPTGVIMPGELLAVKPGIILNSQQIVSHFDVIQGSHQQIAPDLFLAGLTEEQVDDNLVGYNHSCDPNASVIILDGLAIGFLVSRKPIKEGDEITVDYSTCYMSETGRILNCNCGAIDCRRLINPGWDWMNPQIQALYAGEFPDYMQRKINAYNALSDKQKEAFYNEAVAIAFAEEIVVLNWELLDIEEKLAYVRGLPDTSNAGYITLNRRRFREFEQAKQEALANLSENRIIGHFYRYETCKRAIPFFNQKIAEAGLEMSVLDKDDPQWLDKTIQVAYEIDRWNLVNNTVVQSI